MSLWDLVQQIQIQNLKARAVSGETAAERLESHRRAAESALNDRIGRLLLVTEAMWELVAERYGLSQTDLVERVRTIAAREKPPADPWEGSTDEAKLIRCSSCQAVVPPGKTTCQFCGAEVAEAKADPFRL